MVQSEKNVRFNEEDTELQLEKLPQPFHDCSTHSMNDSKYFTMKTIKVYWEESTDAYMHVFINTTNIKRLEKEKATNKCLHIMFSSISHEYRTPLNAFSNALELIRMSYETFTKEVNKFDVHDATQKRLLSKASESIEKNIKIATVSSKVSFVNFIWLLFTFLEKIFSDALMCRFS